MPPSTAPLDTLAARPAHSPRRREHLFFTTMAFAIALIVFAGFARTYFLRPYFHPEPLRPLLHLHGLLFTSWIVLLLAQTTLVAAHRTDLHRRLGVLGGVLAMLMVIVGTTTAIIRAREGFSPPNGPPPQVFLVIPLMDMVLFAGLVSAALYYRRRSDVHKRLMLLGTIAILLAAVARLPFGFRHPGPPLFFALTDILLLPCLVFDMVTRGRIHPATAWGVGAIVASQPLRLMLGGTAAWLAFATWLTG